MHSPGHAIVIAVAVFLLPGAADASPASRLTGEKHNGGECPGQNAKRASVVTVRRTRSPNTCCCTGLLRILVARTATVTVRSVE